jgi:hypothetical protein
MTAIETTVAHLARRRLALPALLFLTAHRPLAFAMGHLLAVAAPVAAVAGIDWTMAWAELLSSDEGVTELETALNMAAGGAI